MSLWPLEETCEGPGVGLNLACFEEQKDRMAGEK